MYILKATVTEKIFLSQQKKHFTNSSGGLFENDRRCVSISQLLIHLKSKYFLSKYTFSGVLIIKKKKLNTLIQQKNKYFTDSSGGHFTKWLTKSKYVSISPLLIHPKSIIFYLNLSKYTFSGVLILDKVFLNTLI